MLHDGIAFSGKKRYSILNKNVSPVFLVYIGMQKYAGDILLHTLSDRVCSSPGEERVKKANTTFVVFGIKAIFK